MSLAVLAILCVLGIESMVLAGLWAFHHEQCRTIEDLLTERKRLQTEVERLTDAIARAAKTPITRPYEGQVRPLGEDMAFHNVPYWDTRPEIIPEYPGRERKS